MNELNDKELLIVRYLDGSSTDDENSDLIKWINSSKENKAEFLKIKDVWDASLKPKIDTELQLGKFYKSQFLRSRKTYQKKLLMVASVAAVLLIGTIFSVLLPLYENSNSKGKYVYTVPLGSRSNMVLPDGTMVFLNSGSELTYSANYNTKNRAVQLKGEAFFDVITKEKIPFIVETKDFIVEATGTKFNVNNYNENDFASTTLAEGIINVRFNGSKQVFAVDAGDKFELNRKSNTYKLGNADIETEIAWKDGQFIFKSIPFPMLVKRLERWYDVKLNYSESEFKGYAFTGSFKNQESIWQVLDALKLTSSIDYKKSNFREFELIYKK